MGNKLILTKQNGRIYSCLFQEDNLIGINIEDARQGSILGNIYVGKVQNIVKNIGAAFVEIESGLLGYLPLAENKHPIYSGPGKKGGDPAVGDELLVQVVRESTKSKGPALSCHLNITGKYLILTHGKPGLGISSKIKKRKERDRLTAIMKPYQEMEYGFIVRTNAEGVSEQTLSQEAKQLYLEYEKLKENGIHRTPFSLVCPALPGFLKDIRDSYDRETEAFLTDVPEIYEAIRPFLPKEKLSFYQDSSISLSRLYGIEEKLKKALAGKVWLKSGGYLIIEPTEALTVIDVNTGKAIAGHSNVEENYFRINREAALEIAKQLRLRNLSGIIIVDFIDMEQKEHRKAVMELLADKFSEDPVRTTLVDMTPLGLVEITRKKIRKPLYEQINNLIV